MRDFSLLTVDENFFNTEEEMKDIAAGIALKGLPLDVATGQIRAGYSIKSDAIKKQYEAASADLNIIIEETREKIRIENERAANLKNGIENRYREKSILGAKVERLEAVIANGLQEIRKLRVEYGKQYFENQGKYLDDVMGKTKQELLEDIKNRSEVTEEIYSIQKDFWDRSKSEFERRAQLYEKELSHVENQLGIARNRVTKLHDVGITRTTANFLIWVGYIALAGIGGVIGGFLQKRQAGETDFLSFIFQGFINLVHLTEPQKAEHGSWWILLAPLPLLTMVVGYLTVIGLLVLFMDWRLKKFDPRWDKEGGSKGRNRSARGRSNLLDRFSSYIPTPDIDRKSYRQLLAYFPYIALAALVVWLFSAGIPEVTSAGAPNPGSAANPTAGLAATYLGVIFTLLSTSAALLYATKIIEPRWKKYDVKNDGKAVFHRYLAVHWEFAFLMLLLILSLVLAAVLPISTPSTPSTGWLSSVQYNHLSWGVTTVFMCLCSLGLAYGLIQRGLFRDVDYLERKRQIYRHQVEKNKIGPTLSEIFERCEPSDDAKALIANYREARHMLDEYRMIYDLKEIFDDDFDNDGSLRKYFRKLWPDSHISLRSIRLKSIPSGEPRPIDYVVAPEETARILTSRAERKGSQDRLAMIDGELQRLEDERVESRNRIVRLNQEITIRRREALGLTQEYERRKSSLMVNQEKCLLKFQSAYAVGLIAHNQLKDEMKPPSSPPPPLDTPLTPAKVM
jgi:hypothetical protein